MDPHKAIPAVHSANFCETTVVVSESAEKATKVAAWWDSIEHGLTDDEFLDGAATDAYDVVYICTPNALHLTYVEAAATFESDSLRESDGIEPRTCRAAGRRRC